MRFSCRLLPALGLILLIAEAGLGVAAIWFPHVPRTYADFYIHHTRGCWLPPERQAEAVKTLTRQEINPAALSIATACYVFENGWDQRPPFNATRQMAVTSWLVLPAYAGAKALEITAAGTSPASAQTLFVSIDNQPAQRFDLPPGRMPVRMNLPLRQSSAGVVRVRFFRPHEPDGNPMVVLDLRWLM